ncbi:MAG: hypothetical protein WAR77_03475 [Saprospiraceae bacterium]
MVHIKYLQNTLQLIFLFLASQALMAQCSPPMSQTCSNANILCSLDEIDGLTCSSSSTIPSSCSPICSQGGQSENTSWWGFLGNGGNASVTITVGTCSNSQGLEFGILGYCKCAHQVVCRSNPCIPPGAVETVNATLYQCTEYYLWVDGCNGDICDFTINTTGGAAPTLDPIGYINNEASRIITGVCAGCYKSFRIENLSDACNSYYVWELDGQTITEGVYQNEIEYRFPNNGEFQLCVTAYIRNPKNQNIICDQQGPQCATVKVSGLPDRIGTPRNICWESANPKGFSWHSQKIYSSGTYRAKLKSGCCDFDSVVQFTVLEFPNPEIVYYISCNNEPYSDLLGKKHFPCLVRSNEILPKTTNPYRCDSTIILTVINANFEPTWSANCINGMIELVPNVSIIKTCDAGETYEFDYSWYKKRDPSKIISKEERLLVNTLSEEYCLNVTVITVIDSEVSFCTKTFCESIDEGNITPECFPLTGTSVFCFNRIGKYRIDTFIPKNVNFYNWTVDGGQIISKIDSAIVDVNWTFNAGDTGKICASYNVDCGTSCIKCIPVFLEKTIAGPDYSQRGLSAYLDALPNPNGIWKLISGPYNVTILDPTNPGTKISAYNYGTYCFEWTITDNNCTLKDTLCIELYNLKKASPEYADNHRFTRRFNQSGNIENQINLYTPNLISENGSSYLMLQNNIPSPLYCTWFDIYGKQVLNQQINNEGGVQRIEINTPKHSGIYFLHLNVGGVQFVNRVCILN